MEELEVQEISCGLCGEHMGFGLPQPYGSICAPCQEMLEEREDFDACCEHCSRDYNSGSSDAEDYNDYCSARCEREEIEE